MVKLVEITSGIFERPGWEELSQAEAGDVFIDRNKLVGVVYEKGVRQVNFCYTDKDGVMYLSSFFTLDGRRAVRSRNIAVANRSIPNSTFNIARSTYTRSLKQLKAGDNN